MIQGHGDDLYKYERAIEINFSSNVYNAIDLSDLKKHLTNKLSNISSYPQPQPFSLESLIALKNNCLPNNVSVTNGATEAIYLIAQAFAGANTTIVSPTFSEYNDACCLYKHNISFISPPLPDNLSLPLTDSEVEVSCFWICNPNNPTGETFNAQRLRTLITNNLNTIFILDESYEYFTMEETISIEEGIKYPNLIILHSLTKSFAIPGLRLGYITACEVLIDKIRSFRMPWSVNSLAIEAGMFLLSEKTKVLDKKLDIPELLQERARVAKALNAMANFAVSPTDTHFMLIEIVIDLKYPNGICSKSASVLKDYLAVHHGILIRDASNFQTLSPSFFRIAVQTPKENDKFLNIILNLI